MCRESTETPISGLDCLMLEVYGRAVYVRPFPQRFPPTFLARNAVGDTRIQDSEGLNLLTPKPLESAASSERPLEHVNDYIESETPHSKELHWVTPATDGYSFRSR